MLTEDDKIRFKVVKALSKIPHIEPPGEETTKRCSKCGKRKKRKMFYKKMEATDGRRPECILCYDKRYRRTKKDRDTLEFYKQLRERKKNGRPSISIRNHEEPQSE